MSKSAWITSKEAASIASELNDHEITDAYIRRLANRGKIETKPIDERTKLYSRADVEKYRIQKRGDGSVRRATRGKKTAEAVKTGE